MEVEILISFHFFLSFLNRLLSKMQSIFDSFSDATLRRLFKFVLKRSLGRFLRDELVLEQVTVNSRNGTISIADLELNPQSINNEIFVDSPLKLRRCMIKRLECSMSYNSLLKDGFKTCLYGVDIGIEPNTINTRSESSSSSSSDSDKVPVSGNYYSKSSNSHNSGTTSLKDESANFDSSGLGFLVSWVEVLIHSIQASVHDIEISIASNTSPTCVINISDIQYLNASNSQVNHETSISEASKLYQSSMRGSTSILNDKLLKVSSIAL